MGAEVSAFVPGHVTGFFTTQHDPDPTKAGSRGAGLTITDGVSVTVRPGPKTEIELNGSVIEMPPVERVFNALDVTARVDASADVPLGAGFGVSGGLSLGSALAANRAFGCGLSEYELVTIAHGAEVQSGTGLGDVVAQARGGIPIRLEPGSPPHGVLDAIPDRARVEYVSFGELSTADVLAGETDHITQAGQTALSRVVKEPTLGSFIFASRRFARETDLLTPTVTEAIRAVNEAGGQASMAMLGETVFALGTGLSDAGYEPNSCVTHAAGATLS